MRNCFSIGENKSNDINYSAGGTIWSENIRLRWFGHARMKYDAYIGRRMLRMELVGKRKQGRFSRRNMERT